MALPKKPKQSIWDKFRDTFDANTAADQYRRAQDNARIVTPDVQRKIANAKYGVLANNKPAQQRFTKSLARTTNNTPGYLRDVGTSLGLAGVRSVTGLGQGVSGLYDLATPGLGTNRFSQGLDRFAKSTDQTIKDQGLPTAPYKIGQFGTDALTFGLGGLPLKAASKIPVVSRAIAPLGKVSAPVSKVIDKGAVKLAAKGTGGRVAAAGLKGAASKSNLANVAAGSLYDIGAPASKGRDVSPTTVATSLGINSLFGAGIPASGQALKEFPGAAKSVAGGVEKAIDKPLQRGLSQAQLQERNKAVVAWNKANDAGKENAAEFYAKKIKAIDDQADQVGAVGKNIRDNGAPIEKTAPFDAETEIPQINRILKNEDTVAGGEKIADYYRNAKGEDWRVVNMTPDEYLDRAARAMGENPEMWRNFPTGDVKKYASDMKKGDKFPMPWVNEVAGTQEGRSRALAAKLNGEKTIPVAVAEKYDPVTHANRAQLEKDIAHREKMARILNGETVTAPSKPKVTVKKTVETPPTTEKPNVVKYKPTTFKPRTTEEALREGAAISGIDIGEASTGLGLTNKAISAATGGKVTNARRLNVFRTVADKAGSKLNEAGEATVRGDGSRLLSGSRAVFAGAGLTDEAKQISRALHGKRSNVHDLVRRVYDSVSTKIDEAGEGAMEMLERAMRDKQYLQRVYGDSKKISPNKLPPNVRAIYDEAIAHNRMVNDLNYQTGVINKEQWMGGTKGQHVGRIFNIPKNEKDVWRDSLNSMFDSTPGIKRKDIDKMSDELIALLEKDPIRAVYLREELALINKAVIEAMEEYAARGFIRNKAPNANYIPINGKRYGKFNGKFMERTMYEEITGNRMFRNQMADSLDRLVNSYKNSIIGVSDRLQKAFKTTMAPATIFGNVMSNIIAFTPGAGTNPFTQTYDMLRAASKMSKGLSDGDVFEARQLGVIGGDTGRLLTGSASEQLAMSQKTGNAVSRTLARFGRFYGSIDDAAKLGLWDRLKKQGLSPQEAALEVAKFTQDYNNVGRSITLLADMPVVGKPFARFSPELVRIMKNNITRAPHRVVLGLGVLAYLQNKLSHDAGETPEERKARETAVGQTVIPGTAWLNKAMDGPDRDLSMNFAVKVGESETAINAARALGLNFPTEPGSSAEQALLEQLLPFEMPTRKNGVGETVFAPEKLVTSMTASPLIGQITDRNFMGAKVSDPANRAYGASGKETRYTELPQNEQVWNRGKALISAYLPLGNEADALISATTKRPTVTGKERTVGQALARAAGLKTEDNRKEARQKRADTSNYFETEKKAEDKFLRENKQLEDLYFSVFPKTKDRTTNRRVSDQISPEKWSKVKAETSGKLFDFMKQQAYTKSKNDGAPIDPIYNLPTREQERVVLELRSRPTGEDIEAEEILRATQSWYSEFEKAERTYNNKNSAYFDKLNLPDTQNERAKAYSEVPLANQPDLVKRYYSLRETNPEAAKNMFKTTKLSDAFDAYTKDRLRYINAKRKIEGHPPISATTFNNVTFGYEEDERKVFNELKYGRGYGGYGSGGGGSSGSSNPYKYKISSKTGKKPGVAPKGKVAKVGIAKKNATSKPKVSIKKSLV